MEPKDRILFIEKNWGYACFFVSESCFSSLSIRFTSPDQSVKITKSDNQYGTVIIDADDIKDEISSIYTNLEEALPQSRIIIISRDTGYFKSQLPHAIVSRKPNTLRELHNLVKSCIVSAGGI